MQSVWSRAALGGAAAYEQGLGHVELACATEAADEELEQEDIHQVQHELHRKSVEDIVQELDSTAQTMGETVPSLVRHHVPVEAFPRSLRLMVCAT